MNGYRTRIAFRTSLIVVAVLAAVPVIAQEATITYLEGFVDIRTEAGAVFPADFGDALDGGDRVITERTGEAELELADGGVVRVAPNTVFIVGSSTGSSGERTSRLSAAVGSFAFRFSAAVGNEPQIGSTTSVAGVRGTEVRVYAASDGTTRYEVIEGLIEITEGGETLTVGADEGVEIAAGRAPGSVFAFLEQPIDYGVWNAGLVDGFLADPLPALRGVATEMNEIIDEIERLSPEIDALFAELEAERARLPEIEAEEGREARERYFLEVVTPLRILVRERYIDFRFIVLSALSLDQYVVSRLAAEMEASFFLSPDAVLYRQFVDELDELRARYEAVVVPRLSPTDF